MLYSKSTTIVVYGEVSHAFMRRSMDGDQGKIVLGLRMVRLWKCFCFCPKILVAILALRFESRNIRTYVSEAKSAYAATA